MANTGSGATGAKFTASANGPAIPASYSGFTSTGYDFSIRHNF
jgi:hypothetical protein